MNIEERIKRLEDREGIHRDDVVVRMWTPHPRPLKNTEGSGIKIERIKKHHSDQSCAI